MYRRSFLECSVALAGAPLQAFQAPAARQPMWFYLHSRMTDHLHIDFALSTLQRQIPAVEQLRADHAPSRVSCLLSFTGASAQALDDFNRSSKVVDKIRAARDRGVVETGYDGYDEPTPRLRPVPNFRKGKTPEARWDARLEAAQWFLTEYKNPKSGEPDPDRPGGLRRMEQVFGGAASVTGYSQEIGHDTEFVCLINERNKTAMLSGLIEPTTYPARNLNGYGGAAAGLGALMSQRSGYVAELYWMDGRVRLSRFGGATNVKNIPLWQGTEAVKKALAAVDRTRLHILHLELGDERLFLRADAPKEVLESPVRYAYENPKAARVPIEMLRTPAEVEAAQAAELQALKWILEEFIPANPGSRFVSNGDLTAGVRAGYGKPVPIDRLQSASQDLLNRWGTNNLPPEFAMDAEQYYSLADLFALLAGALGTAKRAGSMPAAVELQFMCGPEPYELEQGPAGGKVSRAALLAAAEDWTVRSRAKPGTTYPPNRIPAWSTIEGQRLNSAQFLLLLATAFLKPEIDPLPVRTSQMASMLTGSYPSSVPLSDLGTLWTVKPVKLSL
jgi:hypothetical protein